MRPPQQRLHARDLALGGVELRLKDQRQLVVIESTAQVRHQAQLVDIMGIALRVVHRTSGARALGLVHGDIGVLQERVGVWPLVGSSKPPASNSRR